MSHGSSIEGYPTIPLTPKIRKCLFKRGLIDAEGRLLPSRSRRSPPRPSTAYRFISRSDEFDSKRYRHASKSPKRQRARASEALERPRSPVPPQHQRRLLSAAPDRRVRKSGRSVIPPAPLRTIRLRLAVSPPKLRPEQRCLITIQYLGASNKVEYDREWIEPDGDEIIVMQQHCGGENLIVFRGSVRTKGHFQFESRRHSDFPFGVAFYVNGIFVSRLSLCCEARCVPNTRIGGPRGIFLIVSSDNARPCRQCRFKERMKAIENAENASTSEPRRGRRSGPLTPAPGHPSSPVVPPQTGVARDSPPSRRPDSSPSPDHGSGRKPTHGGSPSPSKSSRTSSPDSIKSGQLPQTLANPPDRPGSAGGSDRGRNGTSTHGGSGTPPRPGSPSDNPRDRSETIVPSNPHDVRSDDEKSTGSPSLSPHRPSSPPEDRGRTERKQSAPSPVKNSPLPEATDQKPSWNEIRRSTPSTHSSASASPIGGGSPRRRKKERQFSTDRDQPRLKSATKKSPSPLTNRNQTDTMPSPIPRARDTPTNENDDLQPIATTDDDVRTPSASAVDDDVTEEELRNLPGTTDDDQEQAQEYSTDFET